MNTENLTNVQKLMLRRSGGSVAMNDNVPSYNVPPKKEPDVVVSDQVLEFYKKSVKGNSLNITEILKIPPIYVKSVVQEYSWQDLTDACKNDVDLSALLEVLPMDILSEYVRYNLPKVQLLMSLEEFRSNAELVARILIELQRLSHSDPLAEEILTDFFLLRQEAISALGYEGRTIEELEQLMKVEQDQEKISAIEECIGLVNEIENVLDFCSQIDPGSLGQTLLSGMISPEKVADLFKIISLSTTSKVLNRLGDVNSSLMCLVLDKIFNGDKSQNKEVFRKSLQALTWQNMQIYAEHCKKKHQDKTEQIGMISDETAARIVRSLSKSEIEKVVQKGGQRGQAFERALSDGSFKEMKGLIKSDIGAMQNAAQADGSHSKQQNEINEVQKNNAVMIAKRESENLKQNKAEEVGKDNLIIEQKKTAERAQYDISNAQKEMEDRNKLEASQRQNENTQKRQVSDTKNDEIRVKELQQKMDDAKKQKNIDFLSVIVGHVRSVSGIPINTGDAMGLLLKFGIDPSLATGADVDVMANSLKQFRENSGGDKMMQQQKSIY